MSKAVHKYITIRPKIKREEVQRTDITLSHLILLTFGSDHYYAFKGYHRASSLKAYYGKLLSAFRTAIKNTISNTDSLHLKTLLERIDSCKKLLKLCKDISAIHQTMVTYQSEIIFLLIGQEPDNGHEKNVTLRKENWYLNHHRQIIYLQNDEQRKNVIFSKVLSGQYLERLPDIEKLRKKLWVEYNNDCSLFMGWFKNEYKDVYVELF